MNKTFCLGMALGAALLALSVEGAAPPRSAELPGDDAQDMIFLSDARPVLMRLHVRLDGQAFGRRWDAYVAKLFAFLDRNGDGALDRTEAARAPTVQQMAQYFQGNALIYTQGGGELVRRLDADGDGKVTLDEFARYYRQNGAGPLLMGPAFGYYAPTSPAADALTDVLFKALDANKDGKLSKAELLAAGESLAKFDENDDELISLQELGGNAAFNPSTRARVRLGRLAPAYVPAATPLLFVEKDKVDRRMTSRLLLARQVLVRYDKNKDGKLSRDEIGFSKEAFDRIDTNRDGKLDVVELAKWTNGAPEVEMVVRLGKTAAGEAMLSPVGDGTVKRAPRQVNGAVASFRVDNSQVNVVRGGAVGNGFNYKTYIQQQFHQISKANKGFVTRQQVQPQQYLYLRFIFELADRNGDERLTEAELNAYLDVVAAGAGAQTAISFAETGRGLFQLLDANGDGSLSPRELRNAWERVKDLDKDGDGCISRTEIPRQYQLTVGSGPTSGQPVAFLAPRIPGRVGVRPAPARGPVWFRKMDRNGDGDVSRREFLGTTEDFRRIDVDGDGLISLEEAERADAWFRSKAK